MGEAILERRALPVAEGSFNVIRRVSRLDDEPFPFCLFAGLSCAELLVGADRFLRNA